MIDKLVNKFKAKLIYVSSRTFDAMIYDTSSKFRLGTKVGHFNRLVSWTFLGQSKGNNGFAKILRVIFGKISLELSGNSGVF